MNIKTPIKISKSEIDAFMKGTKEGRGDFAKYRGLRLGQAFHQYFKLEKVVNEENKLFCDQLYESDGDNARKMIESITDHSQ